MQTLPIEKYYLELKAEEIIKQRKYNKNQGNCIRIGMGKGQRKSGQWKDMKEEKKVRRRIGLRTGVQKKGKKE